MSNLREIVSAALRQAHNGVKVASLRDAPIEDRGFARVDEYLAAELGQLETEEPEKVAEVAIDPSTGLDDVNFALKLAEALTYGADVVEKLALEGALNKSTGGPPRPGPTPQGGPVKVLAQPFANDKVISPEPQASAHARRAQANKEVHAGYPKNDEDMQINEGPVIPENYPNGVSRTTGQQSKHASRADIERILRSKIAQHRMLVSLGQIDAAEAVLKEAQEIEAGSLVYNDSALGTHFPDNTQVQHLTKAMARDANQREAGSYFGEPVKKDNAVAAHTLSTEGLKLSGRKQAGIGSFVGGIGKSIASGGSNALMAGSNALNKMRNTPGQLNALTRGAVRLGDQTAHGMHKAIGAGALGAGALGAGAIGAKVLGRNKEAYESKGTGASALLGPAGTLVAGEHQNRGRRFLGSMGGNIAGGAAGGALGRLAGKTPQGKLIGGLAGLAAGSTLGSAAGNAAVQHYTGEGRGRSKKAYESKGTGAAALLGPTGTLVAGEGQNRGRRFLGSMGGSLAGGAAGGALGRLAGRTPQGKLIGGLAGLAAGSTLGSAGGNAAVQHYTGEGRGRSKKAYESKGTGAAALLGPTGTLVAGEGQNRGRRFLGSMGGSLAGGAAGGALGRLAGKTPQGKLIGGLAGLAAGSTLGSAGGNAAVQHYTGEHRGRSKRAYESKGTGAAALLGPTGTLVAGEGQNRGRRFLGSMGGSLAGGAAGGALGRLAGKTPQGKLIGGLAGLAAGSTLGSAGGNAAVQHYTGEGRNKRAYESKGTGAALLAGPAGTLVAGEGQNRGRRFLGATGGQIAGGALGALGGGMLMRRGLKAEGAMKALRNAATQHNQNPDLIRKAVIGGGAMLGATALGHPGAAAGNALVQKYTGEDRKKKRG